MNWTLVPQQIATGLLNGGTIALIALGVVLIFKSSEVFNFAQGHMLMIGAFLTWWFAGGAERGIKPFDMPPLLAVTLAFAIAFIIGFLIERFTSRSIIKQPLLAVIPLMIGAFLAWWFTGGADEGTSLFNFNLPLLLAVTLAFGAAFIIGFLIERFALRPMTGQPLLAIVLMTLGLAQLLEGISNVAFGVVPKSNFPTPFPPTDTIRIPFPGAFNDAIILQKTLVLTFVVAGVAAIVFGLFFRYTKVGLAMRATSEDHELARSVGINVPRVFALSWAIAGVIATAGGVLLAMLSGVSQTLSVVVLVAFPAILLGGLESLAGAVVGGLAVGLVQALVQASTIVEVRNSKEIAPYILLLIVLVIRPEGIFGQKRIERV